MASSKHPPDDGGNTLGELISLGYAVHAHCRHCSRTATLDLVAISVAKGEASRIGYIARKLACASCGSRGAEIAIAGR